MKIPKDVIAALAKKQKSKPPSEQETAYDINNDALALLVREMDREKEAMYG